jgi:hypothetical protein
LNPSHKTQEVSVGLQGHSGLRQGTEGTTSHDRAVSPPNPLSMLGLRRGGAMGGHRLASAREDVVASS